MNTTQRLIARMAISVAVHLGINPVKLDLMKLPTHTPRFVMVWHRRGRHDSAVLLPIVAVNMILPITTLPAGDFLSMISATKAPLKI